jgi:hypothetical protein
MSEKETCGGGRKQKIGNKLSVFDKSGRNARLLAYFEMRLVSGMVRQNLGGLPSIPGFRAHDNTGQ